MSAFWIRVALLSAGLLPAAHGEFQLFVVNGSSEQAAPPRFDLGTVFAGDAAQVQFRLRNMAAGPAVLNYLEVRGTGFEPKNPLALPLTLQPQASVDFTITFSAPDPGTYSAALVSEGVSVILTAKVETGPPLPVPQVIVHLASPLNGFRGIVQVKFDAPALRGGSGTVNLDFNSYPAGAIDRSVVFLNGTRTDAFTFAAGDTEGQFHGVLGGAFQTGTTAGTLTLTARVGSLSAQAAVTIAPASVSLAKSEGVRAAASVEVRLTGYDNTRTAGPLVFTFFDQAGNPIAPGTIRADAGTVFEEFYQTSDMGGVFLLRAVFPVSGDASRVAAFEASISNSEGTTLIPRTNF